MRGKGQCDLCNGRSQPRVPSRQYSYLLGQYLGDGTISSLSKGVFSFRVFSDMRYLMLIRECAYAMRAVMPANMVRVAHVRDHRMVVISSTSKHWPCLFPQHGLGRKHERRIRLESWQEGIVEHHPEALIRGLIHSDGCRVINRVKGGRYEYPRYMFSNRSADIHRIFVEACDQLGIEWRRMNPYTTSISRAGSVAAMDTFVGPKA